jgi:glycerol-3-phosphate acyltransferase PlsX
MKMLKREIADVTTGKLGYLMIKPAIKNFKKRTEYSEYGGAPLLGINGISIISHGRSSARAVKNALRVAAEMSRRKVHEIIADKLNNIKHSNDKKDISHVKK